MAIDTDAFTNAEAAIESTTASATTEVIAYIDSLVALNQMNSEVINELLTLRAALTA